MKVIMYGAEICPDCVQAKEVFGQNSHIELDYRNITESTTLLKEFLSYRDHDPIFAPVIEGGKIGIPFFLLEDGSKTFEITDILTMDASVNGNLNACSIDGVDALLDYH